MASAPQYSLTWGEYGTSLVSAVQLLRCHGDLVDVTLAAGGKTFHAHKVVLCAASPFLLDLLKSTTCKHPVVMLAGVQACDLEALLEFVYRGEVSIDPNQLPSLLQAAHCLNIQGLAPVSAGQVQQVVKTATDVPIQVQTQIESPTVQDETETVPVIKRKKRLKRLSKSPVPPTSPNKWPKVIINTECNENTSVEQETNAHTWDQQMNINNETNATIETLSLQHSLLLPNVRNAQNLTSTHKINRASDQPSACPLCGLMLRQARNLRRHLLISCKYRMVNGQNSSNIMASQTGKIQESNEQELHTIALHGLDTINQQQANMDSIEMKPVVLTSVNCSELLPNNSDLITMDSSSMQ